MKNDFNLYQKIKSMNWDNRVQRSGFLQSKSIINKAETQAIKLTPKIKIKQDNILWVKESNLYDQDLIDKLPAYLKKAFAEDKNWPLKIVKELDSWNPTAKTLIKKLSTTDWQKSSSEQKISTFKEYSRVLKGIQKYYVIAVPLTDYCERQLNRGDLMSQASPIAKLEVDSLNRSLVKIKKVKNTQIKKDLIKKHLDKFAWIKTAYNIIDYYKEAEVLEELKNIANHGRSKSKVRVRPRYLFNGLRAGIYLRNRMKELSQQIWFAVEPLAQAMAKEINLARDDFFQLTEDEVLVAMTNKKTIVKPTIVKARQSGFVVGILDDKEFIFTGQLADGLHQYFNKNKNSTKQDFIKGTTASAGKSKGKVKIILKKNEFYKLNAGEILVTSMATPDFIVIMKRASAIVTDEGGLSCHAAIVSRELGIPCIIGTKIATQVLKDGDLVEVDADKGVVRKIR